MKFSGMWFTCAFFVCFDVNCIIKIFYQVRNVFCRMWLYVNKTHLYIVAFILSSLLRTCNCIPSMIAIHTWNVSDTITDTDTFLNSLLVIVRSA